MTQLTCDFLLPEGRYRILFYFLREGTLACWDLPMPTRGMATESFNGVKFAIGTKLSRVQYARSDHAKSVQALGRVSTLDNHRQTGHIEAGFDWVCGTQIDHANGPELDLNTPVTIGSNVAFGVRHRRCQVRLVIAFTDVRPNAPPPQPKGRFLFHGVRFVPC